MAIEIARLVEAQQQTIGRLHERQRLLEYSAQIHDTLMQLLLTNQGIPAIAATLARTVSAPVLVQDQFAEVLAGANGQGQLSTELRPVSRTILDDYARRHENRSSQSPFEVPALPKRGLDEPRAIAPIVANQQVPGHVSVVLPALPASPLTLLALEQSISASAPIPCATQREKCGCCTKCGQPAL
jgi:hypothetical protein